MPDQRHRPGLLYRPLTATTPAHNHIVRGSTDTGSKAADQCVGLVWVRAKSAVGQSGFERDDYGLHPVARSELVQQAGHV